MSAKKPVIYKGHTLATNSQAYVLWENEEFLALDLHLKMLDRKNVELLEHYEEQP